MGDPGRGLGAGGALIVENEGIGLRQDIDVTGSILVTAAVMVGIYAIVGATPASRRESSTSRCKLSAAIGLAGLGTISSERTRGLQPHGLPLCAPLTRHELPFTVASACVAAGLLAALVLLQRSGAR